ncbi:hypothetical protein EDD21DRAFT_239412 [Dissophora ornata]|nr:hypothetical protein EDD21DRAFT_239412 [Dissophora ornata]
MTLSSVAIAIIVGLAGYIAAPFLFIFTIGMLGYSAAGIAAGSWAASFMASYGGTVVVGSICVVLQSIGAAGLGAVGTVVVSIVGALAGVAAVVVAALFG